MREPHRGPMNIPSKNLAGASQTSLTRILLGTLPSGLQKDLHTTMQTPLGLGLDIVDGVRALNLKGGGLVSASQAVPARILPGVHEPPREGSCRESACLLLFGYWLGRRLGHLVFRL